MTLSFPCIWNGLNCLIDQYYRYCYSGLRKKLKLNPPGLPDMQEDEEKSEVKIPYLTK